MVSLHEIDFFHCVCVIIVTSRLLLICVAGRNHTQVAVIVYGGKPAVAVTWRDKQTEDNLLKLLETLHSKTDNKPRLGKHAVKTQQLQYSLTVKTYATLHTCGRSFLFLCRSCSAIGCADSHFLHQWGTDGHP